MMKAATAAVLASAFATAIAAKPNPARSLVELDLDRDVAKQGSKKPNIVLILTDDQDVSTVKREYLPKLFEHVADHGTRFDNFFAPVSVCCPSRVSLLRTQLAHNHNVTFVTPPWGGWVRFNELGYVNHTLPDFLQKQSYNTYYTGKFQNHHTVDNCESLPVSGFNSSDILVDPYTYDYWSPAFSRDNGPAKIHKGEYSTDLVKEKALAYLDDALGHDAPFFLGIAPVACHSWISDVPDSSNLKGITSDIPAAHPRHQRLFNRVQAPRKESWNYKEPLGVSWVKKLPQLTAQQEAYLDEFYRGRLRALQPVDELVEQVVQKLEKAGQLDNTYIFYTADNGYSGGYHRRNPGKTLGFEEDIHVPFLVRGPTVKAGQHDTTSSWGMVDLSATILAVAGARTDYTNDGNVITQVLPPKLKSDVGHISKHSISEYWVLGVEEGEYGGGLHENNTYRTIRVHDVDERGSFTFSYSVWCTGERELYDLDSDPSQVRNLLAPLNAHAPFAPFDARSSSGEALLAPDLQRVVKRLDALILVLKSCKGDVCRDPYRVLFPNLSATGGQVSSVFESLESRFDDFYEGLPKVEFAQCALGYQTRFEHPIWKDALGYGFGAHDSLRIQ